MSSLFCCYGSGDVIKTFSQTSIKLLPSIKRSPINSQNLLLLFTVNLTAIERSPLLRERAVTIWISPMANFIIIYLD